jgi:hypothetical protein
MRREIANLYPAVIACDKREAFAQESQRVAMTTLEASRFVAV